MHLKTESEQFRTKIGTFVKVNEKYSAKEASKIDKK